MIKNKNVRIGVAAMLGGFAGVSFVMSVLPMVISSLGYMDSFLASLVYRDYAAPVALLWALGGGLVGRSGDAKKGAFLLSAVGLATGLILGRMLKGADSVFLFVSTVGGACYGFGGGLLLGTVFRAPEEEPGKPKTP